MQETVHTHGNSPPHEHADATPGHTHPDYGDGAPATAAATTAPAAATTPVVERPAAVDVRPTAGGMVARILLTLLGAAGLIIGAFLPWFRFSGGEAPVGTDLSGVNTSYFVFYSTDQPFGADLIRSAGAVIILVGILALLGLAPRTGWLTTLAGVLGIVAFALVLITLYRVPDLGAGVSNVGLGLWLVLAGGIVAVIAGFFGARPRAIAETRARY
jgi:hypothetical protein